MARLRSRPAHGRLADVGFVAFLVLCVVGTGFGVHYHGQRLEREALAAHRKFAALDARHFEDHFTQTLNTVTLTLQSLLETGYHRLAQSDWNTLLGDALWQAPHLRSLSLVDDAGRVVASSNPANIGLQPPLGGFLPEADPWAQILRIGPLQGGRDLHDGSDGAALDGPYPEQAFIPVSWHVDKGESGSLTLLAALNADYFLNHLSARGDLTGEWVEVLDYDGRLLLTTLAGTPDDAVRDARRELALRWQAGEAAGDGDQTIGAAGDFITAWRLARVHPVAVVTRTPRDAALAGARAETRRTLITLVPLVCLALAMVLAAYVLLRRAGKAVVAQQAREIERFSTLLDALPANVLMFDAKGSVLVANESWRQFAREQALTLTNSERPLDVGEFAAQFDLCPDAAAASALDAGIRAVLRGERAAFEDECGRGNGDRRRWLHTMVRPFGDGPGRGAVVLQTDVTRRHQAEERLRLDARVFEVSAEAIVVTDARNHIVSVNPAFTRITGYAAEEVVGRNPALLASGSHDTAFYRDMWQTLERERVWQGEIVNRRKSGDCYTEQLTITLDEDAAGRIRHHIGVFSDISARKAAEDRLRLLSAALDAAANAVVITDRSAVIEWGNPAFSRLTGYSLEEAIGRRPADLIKSGRQSKAFYQALWQTILGGTEWRGEVVNRHKDGHLYHEALTITPVRGKDGTPCHYIAVKEDVSERKATEAALDAARARLATIIANFQEAVLVEDEDRRVVLANQRLCDMFALPATPQALIGSDGRELSRWASRVHADGQAFLARLEALHAARQPALGEEIELIDGRVLERDFVPIAGEGGFLGYFRVYRDMTERKERERELRRLAATDALTGVDNRRAFLEKLELEILRARRYGKPAALLMLDLDHFKRVNDCWGHGAGDTVLKTFAATVTAALRRTDAFGRLGGEEFAVLLPETDEGGASEFAERLRACIADTPIAAGADSIGVTVSIGIAVSRPAEAAAETLLARADEALYRAKTHGRNRVEATP